ncbi:MAG: sulfotransferase domain-containing protein [Mariprofundaceae bacterium]|nr:sulfotransferase domain-containing protein [Mariprofundaceae bacterium]
MLVVCNGAFKSGSTWVYEIVKAITGYPLPPQQYLNPYDSLPDYKKNNDGIVAAVNPSQLQLLLNSRIHHSSSYVCKNHLRAVWQQELLSSDPDCRIVDVRRDIRDVIVSAYYHDCRAYHFSGDFRAYYWSLGRLRAVQVLSHYKLWHSVEENVYVLNYQQLKDNFVKEVQKLGIFLGFTLSEQQIHYIQEQTSIGTMRKKWNEQKSKQPFFRKGISGDWEEHMDSDILYDLEDLQGSKTLARHRKLWSGIKAVSYIPSLLLLEKMYRKLTK